MSLVYSTIRMVAVPVLRTLWTIRVEGMDAHLPARGPVILAANHLSVSDHLFLPAVCPRQVSFLAKVEYFTGRGVQARATATFLRAIGLIPVNRDGGRAAAASLQQAQQVLRAGRVFGFFPEGTRSPDGRLYRGKTGVARIALRTGAPVLPIGLVGTDRAQPPGTPLPRIRHQITVKVGPAVDFSRYAGRATDRHLLRSMTDEIMGRIATLSGQELVDRYAPRRQQTR
jgi:1-acyl-sn-glycerol-3-phosphate acyltransferase